MNISSKKSCYKVYAVFMLCLWIMEIFCFKWRDGWYCYCVKVHKTQHLQFKTLNITAFYVFGRIVLKWSYICWWLWQAEMNEGIFSWLIILKWSCVANCLSFVTVSAWGILLWCIMLGKWKSLLITVIYFENIYCQIMCTVSPCKLLSPTLKMSDRKCL